MTERVRKRYPTDLSDEVWAFAAPHLALMSPDAPQREHPLRDVFDALRWIVRAGAAWRILPGDFPPWEAVYRQTRRWIAAGVFERVVHDLRVLRRLEAGREPDPTAVLEARTLRSTVQNGGRAGYDGHKRTRGAKVHAAVDTLGHLPALKITPADEQERAQVAALAEAVQQATGEAVELAYVDQGYTGGEPAEAAKSYGIRLEVVRHPEAKRGFVLLPRRWVVERSFDWASRFRRLARDYERLPHVLSGLHFVAFACLMLSRPLIRLLESA